jgi:ketosteroid isomerase-like protein
MMFLSSLVSLQSLMSFILGRMCKAAILLLMFPALAGAAPPQSQTPSATLQADFDSLVANERAFAALGEKKGVKESFLAYIADDGVLFRPGPVNGKEALSSRPNPPVVLTWAPSYAEIARSGDLGWTTGPWDLTSQGSTQQEHGQFATVWRRQPDGGWKFVLDLGISTPTAPPSGEPKLSPELVQAEPGNAAKADAEASRASLLAADRGLAQAALSQGLAAAYLAAVAPDVHLLRDGHLPFVGKEAVRGALADDPGGLAFEPAGSGVSSAGDLGYVYGTARRGKPEETGSFFRVWERPPGGAWTIALDVVKLTPVPPPGAPKPPGSN